jgi:hypothetical protein
VTNKINMPFKSLLAYVKKQWETQWKPLMAARESMDDDYNFSSGRRGWPEPNSKDLKKQGIHGDSSADEE